ncbi:DUF6776 family protein [Kangiella sediminilitoris]|uniref:Transmembrane protein n=1 Tax=Kangiella sediminilitoris TaxID=1144748 RepID=A0A1B3BD83_9GAMM|nr:DUF6776 family protein [Kangiella sediminilitoris]AOE50723.1 hypothetical protein KS2013_2016 [Kangiella sediminilitoris]
MAKDPNQPDYIIRKRRSGTWYWAWALVILFLLVAAMIFGYWLNKRQHGMSVTVQERFDELQERLTEAEAGQTHWQQQYQIEHEITQQLKTELDKLHRQKRGLEKEREALQRIFDPDAVDSGLQIASMYWEEAQSNVFQYRLMLIQAKRQSDSLKGNIKISIVGEEAGERKSYDFDALNGTDSQNGKFDFTYVSSHTGSFEVPDGFKPSFIRVVVATAGRNAQSVLQDFTWKPINSSNEVDVTNAKEQT